MYCRKCGNNISDGQSFCSKCGEITELNNQNIMQEDIFKGIIGAILGSLVGAIAIIIIGQLGFVASVSGLVMAIATINLYEKFAKRISKKGIIICILVMIITTFLAVNMSISISIASELKKEGLDANVFVIFQNFFKILNLGYIDVGNYIIEIVMIYGFTILGAFTTIKAKINELKK